jgi:hypothetical protein
MTNEKNAALFSRKSRFQILCIAGCATLLFLSVIINLLTTPHHIWFHYLIFAIIWWPLSGLYRGRRSIKGYSIAGAAIIIAFLTLTNYLESPQYIWAPLAYCPVLMWPIAIHLGRRIGKLNVALCGSLTGILYYAMLNIYLFPGFPWAIFPAFALLWWPLAAAFAKWRRHMPFAAAGSLLSAVFFIAVNAVTTPNTVWAVFPIFALSWWPLSVYYFHYRRNKINA